VSSFSLVLYDETGKAEGALEAAIRNAKDWKKFWAGKGGPISLLWADSRKQMFATEGVSTGANWPKYTPLEQRYWLPIKRWSLGVSRIAPGSILRWTPTPRSATPAAHERLYPSMTVTNHPNYVYSVNGTQVQLGTSLTYARNHNLGVGAYTRRTSRKKSGTVTVPTPKRPLVRFGKPFAYGVQQELNRTALLQSAGKKVGITSQGLADRVSFARSQGRP
jgi:hypothetical protein